MFSGAEAGSLSGCFQKHVGTKLSLETRIGQHLHTCVFLKA